MASGRLSAVEVCQRLEEPSQDPVIGAVLDRFEIETLAVRAVTKWQWKREPMPRESWRAVARTVVFLHGDQVYRPRSVWGELRKRMAGFEVEHDGLWPFEDAEQLASAKRRVRLLKGG